LLFASPVKVTQPQQHSLERQEKEEQTNKKKTRKTESTLQGALQDAPQPVFTIRTILVPEDKSIKKGTVYWMRPSTYGGDAGFCCVVCVFRK
jgi:hypothetical protein